MKKLYFLLAFAFISLYTNATDLFWVGGSGSWNDVSHWSYESGGPGGAHIPGSNDNVFIDQHSFPSPGLVSLTGVMYCKDLTVSSTTGYAGISGSGDLYLAGSLSVASRVSIKYSGAFHFSGEGTIESLSEITGDILIETTYPKSYKANSSLRFNEEFSFKLISGGFSTNNFHVTFGRFSSPGVLPRSLDLTTSRVYVNKGWDLSQTGGLMFKAGTSRIRPSKFTAPENIIPGNVSYYEFLSSRDNSCPPLNLVTGFTPSPCNNDNTAFAWVTATGCVGPYTYSWNSNNASSTNDTTFNLPPGTYTITVTCDGTQFCDDDVFVTEPAAVRFNSINIVNPTCFATCNGSATVSSGGGTSPRTITWFSYPSMTQLATGVNTLGGLCSGQSYLIRVKDSRNCIKDSIINIANPTQVLPNVTSTNITCNSFCNGTATSTPTGGNNTAYTYSWSTGATTPSISALCPGSYTVTVTDASNCTNTQAILITEPTPLAVTTSFTNPSCNNTCDGTISLTVSGGTSPYTFSWSDGATTEDRNNLCGGSYTVDITDAQGCLLTRSFNLITPPPLPVVGTGGTICNGGNFSLTATGAGVGGTYTWNPGNLVGASVSVSPNTTTTYTVTGSSTALCANTDTAVVIVNPLPNITTSPSQTDICTGSCVNITASGAGSGTYTWTPGSVAGAVFNACPTATTTYTVTGTDANGCSNNAPAIVNVNPLPVITASPSVIDICFGTSTQLTASGAGPGGTYLWNPGGATGTPITVSPTATTTYTVTGTNATTTCWNTAISTVRVMPLPLTSATATPAAICLGSSTTLTASAGTSYSWSPTTTPSTGTPVTASPTSTTTYTVTVTGANGCTDTAQVQVIVNPLPNVTATPSSASICSGSSQTIISTGAVTYNWNPATVPSTGSTVTASPTATTTYTVTGTDNIGCRDTAIAVVNVNPLPTVTATPRNTNICTGLSATLSATGAGATGSYSWTPGGGTGPSITVSPASTTTYTVTGTDANGCRDTSLAIVTISNPFSITVTASPQSICIGASSTLSVSGAGPTGVYTWTPGGMTGTSVAVNPTSTTTYTVTASNSTGCQDIDTVIVNVNPLPSIQISPANPAVCVGSCTNLTVSGGVTYLWNPGGSTNAAINVCPASTSTYTVTGTDANGCINSDTSVVRVNPLPVITATPAQTAVCFGSSTSLSASGAGSGTYEWNPGGLTGTPVIVSPTVATTYSVTGTDANGCVNTAASIVNVNPLPAIVGSATPTVICVGGSSTLSASGAGTGGTYIWNPGAIAGPSTTVTPLTTTTYTVTGTNSNSCINIDTAVVVVTPLPNVTATASVSPICLGASTTLTASGASTYSWSPSATLSSATGVTVTATPTGPTSYTVTGTTAGGCVGTGVVFVNTNALPPVAVTPLNSVICFGDSLSLTASGASTYSWSPSTDLSATSGVSVWASPVATTTYTVTGTDANGCFNTATSIVNVNTLPLVTATPSNTSICPGACVSVTASGAGTGASYTWTPSAGLNTTSGTTVNACPAVTTTYTVTGADQFGCGGIATAIVQIAPVPAVSVSPSNTSVCLGSSVTLNASGGTSYNWSPSAGLNTTTGNTVQAAPGSTTTYTVTGTSGIGCPATATAIVNVLPLPVVSVSAPATTICENTSIVLTGSGASNYSWDPGSSTGTTVSFSPSATTTYTVTGTASNGCTDTAAIVINVIPAPVISAGADKSMCLGSNVTLSATGAGGTGTYNWTPLTGLSTPASSVTIASPSSTTTYTVTGTNSSGCSDVDQIIVTVNVAAISAGPDVAMCNGSGATLNASGGVSYIWSPPSNLSNPNISNPVATPASLTTYTVTATDANGCSATDMAVVIPDTVTVAITGYNTSGCGNSDGALVAVPSAGMAPYTYSWSCSPSTADSIGNLSAGICSVTVTDAGGCVAIGTGTVSDPVNITNVFAVTDASTCSGSDGAISISPSGGVGAYTFNWSGQSGFTSSSQNISGLTAGVYYVSITDENNCTAIFNDTVFDPTPSPLSVLPASATICPGASVNLTATAGFVSYSWSPSASLDDPTIATPVATPSTTTVYSVSAVDANQCTSTAFTTITVTPPIPVDAGPSQSVCPGGSVTLAGSGGGAAGTYTWTADPSLSATNIPNPVATVTTTTTYTLTVTVGSCSNTDTVVVSAQPLALSTTKTNVTSCGGSNGSLTVNASGGTSPYTYSWSTTPSQNTATITNLPVGLYSVLVTDAEGCSASATDSIAEPAIFTISETHINSTTCSSDDGSIDITVNGGTSPYTYSWSGCSLNATTEDVSGLSACTYVVTVTDGTGCSGIRSVVISEPAPTPVSAGNDASICDGSTSQLNVTNVAGALYSWTPAASLSDPSIFNPVATPSATTTYTVSVTDGNGCVSSDEVVINVNDLTLSATTTTTSSCGTTDGSATVTVSGGTVPFTYSWSDGQTTATASNLEVGSYSVTVTDNLGCSDTLHNVFITSPASFTASSVSVNTSTCTATDGSISITVNGGTAPFDYFWNPAGSGPSSSGLAPGIYTILVVDSNDCSFIVTDTITNPTPTIANAGNDVTVCNGTSFVLSAAAGGVTYDWSPSTGLSTTTGATVTASPVTTTTYTLSMIDANACVDTDLVVVRVVNIPTVNAGVDLNICSGSSGTLNAFTSGTSVLWSPGSGLSATSVVNPVASPLITSTYTLTAYNNAGCANTDTVIVNVYDLQLSITSTDATSCNVADGTASVSVNGGSGSYQYGWNPGGQSTSSVSNLAGGFYTVTVTDANVGCSATATATIDEPASFTLSAVKTDVTTCNGTDGTIDLTVNGTTGPFTYTWSNGQFTEDLIGLSAGSYTVSVTDTNGCTRTLTRTITLPAAITVNAGSDVTACIGDTVTLQVTTSATGAIYSWSPSATLNNPASPNPSLIAATNQQYIVTVTDQFGCSGVDSVLVTVSNIALGAAVSNTTTCGATDGIVNLNVTGGTTPYTYSWTGPSPFTSTSEDLTGVGAGVYSVVVTDAAGCSDTASYPVSEPSGIIIVLDSITSPDRCGGNGGAIYVTVSGGSLPYTYSWTGGTNSVSEDITSLSTGTYNLLVTDATGCSTAFTNTLSVPIQPAVFAGNDVAVCLNDSVQLSANGSVTYSWSPSAGLSNASIANPKASPAATTTYTVTGTDADGCTTTDTLVVNVNPLPVADAGTDVAVCPGADATLTATGGVSYLWMPSTGLSSPTTAATLVLNVTAVATYSVQVTDANGCSNQDTVVVNLNNLPVVDAGADVTICSTSCTQLNGTSVPAAATYSWTPSGVLDNAAIGNPQACPSATTTFTLTITDVNGCWNTDSVVVAVTPAIQINAGPDLSMCSDFSQTISATAGLAGYEWSPATFLSCTNCASPVVDPTATTTYTVTGTDNLGCATTDTVIVTVADLAVSPVVTQPTNCFTNNGEIALTTSGGTTPYTYSWSNGAVNDTISVTAGTFTLVVTDQLGCTDTSSYDILSLTPVLADAGPDTSFCEGTSFTLNGSNTVNASGFVWTQLPSNTQIATTQNAEITPATGLSTYVLSASNGFCSDKDTVQINSAVKPVANAGNDITIILNTTGVIGGAPTSTGGSMISWSPSEGLSDSTASNPVASPIVTTTYAVTVTNDDGCSATDTMVVTVLPQISFPNGFTPNGDRHNEKWIIDNIEQFPDALIQVYNRWGELLFTSVGYNEPWDGTYNGQPVPVGTYYYIIDLNDERFPETYTGPLTIIR